MIQASPPGRVRWALTATVLFSLAGCRPEATEAPPGALTPMPVRTIALAPSGDAILRLPGVLRSERETPLSFRLVGEIAERRVAAGAVVQAGQVLFRLDDRDLRHALAGAEATRLAAAAEAGIEAREAARREELARRGVTSAEAAERAIAEARASAQRLLAAEAETARAVLMLERATLTATAPGIVTEIHAEAGQVVVAGQAVAVLAHAGGREAEVFIPESRRAGLPGTAQVLLHGEATPRTARLREVAAAAEPGSRSYRARFTIEGVAPATPIGSSLTVTFATGAAALQRVPVSAIAETGDGPFLWRAEAGRATVERIRIVRIEGEDVLVETALLPGTPVVAMGVHRLTPGATLRVVP